MTTPTSVNILGQISHFFTSNRPLSILLLVAILLFGLAAFTLTPKQYNPEIIRPAFLVSLTYDGATTEAAVDRVVYELVEKVRTVPGVDDILTTVENGGIVETTVIFEVGYDATKAKLDLRSQLDQHKYLAQGFIEPPTIMEINPETIPVLQIVLGSPTLTPTELRAQVVELGRELGSVDGVSGVTVRGGDTSAVVVSLHPERLAAAGVTAADVMDTLHDAQVRQVLSGVTAESYRIELVLEDERDAVATLGALSVTEGVLVRDVADVYEGQAGDRSYVWYDNGVTAGEVVVLAVAKVEGTSAPVVTRSVLAALDRALLQASYQDLSYQVVGDDGATAAAEINGLTQNLLTSIAIVAAVLVLFLSTRAALTVLIAIPVTLLIVFGLGWLFGETINRITLFALILSLGLLVDSAIVVVENIYAHLEDWRSGDSPLAREQVIAQAVHEIGVGLSLSTVTSIIVFLPMGYITGMMGPYMGPIAFFVPAALFVSLVVAIVVTPFIASHLITGEERRFRISAWFSGQLDRLIQWYSQFLRRILTSRTKQRWLLRGALGIFIVSLILPLTGLVHFQMLPKADRDQIYLYLDAPVDTSVQRTHELTMAVTDVVLAEEAVINVQAYVGEPPVIDFNGMFKGAQGRDGDHQATVRVNFLPVNERDQSSTDLTNVLRAAVSAAAPDIAPYVRFMEEPPGPPVQATFVAKVQTDEQLVREDVAARLYQALPVVSGVVDPYLSVDESVGRTVYYFDEVAAAQRGVSRAAVADTLMLLSQPVVVSEYRASEYTEMTSVLTALSPSYRDAPSDISHLSVRSRTGEIVPLSAVLRISTQERPGFVQLEGSTPVTYVSAEVEGRSIVYVMIDTMRLLARGEVAGLSLESWSLFSMTLRDEVSDELVRIEWGGEWEMTLENFRDLGVAMGVALILVYGVLVAQYNRFATPAYILVTVPLGLVGILWGFLVLDITADIYLTATALIGFIALIGLVVNNAIIFLEYVEQEKAAGRVFSEALINAGQARLRPILLTSLTTVLGSLTIASDPVWSGLAWAIVFGLSLSTILTLVIYPTLLMYFTSGSNSNQK